MIRLLSKILLARQGLFQLLFAIGGLALGIFIVMMAWQLYTDVQILLSDKAEESEYIIINKKITLANTMNSSVSQFKPEEIDSIRKQDFVFDLAGFDRNTFKVNADFSFDVGFDANFFLEAVPEKFLDKTPEDFKWQKGDKFIPVMISAEFVRLYNFGVATSQGLPQMPESAIQMFPFKIIISGNGKEQVFDARVVGFSERVPSVVVPTNFMNWANENFGSKQSLPNKLIAKVDLEKEEAIKSYLSENYLQTNEEKLKSSKIAQVLQWVLTAVGFIGMVFIALSLVIFVVHFQLLISRAQTEISLLLDIGYATGKIQLVLNLLLIPVILLIGILAFYSALVGIEELHTLLKTKAAITDLNIQYRKLIEITMGILLFTLIINNLFIYKTIRGKV
ncbi:MAG: hypothetical protein WD334_02380 [Chitinophagales bacterium]